VWGERRGMCGKQEVALGGEQKRNRKQGTETLKHVSMFQGESTAKPFGLNKIGAELGQGVRRENDQLIKYSNFH
jgi:hypothetical protein